MTETMLDANGKGLAGPQVHISKQVAIIRVPENDTEAEDKPIKISVLINPKLSKTSEEISKVTGGISIPPGFKLPF